MNNFDLSLGQFHEPGLVFLVTVPSRGLASRYSGEGTMMEAKALKGHRALVGGRAIKFSSYWAFRAAFYITKRYYSKQYNT